MLVEEVVQRKVYACNPEDDIHVAQTMREEHVRRLPVVDFYGNLAGVCPWTTCCGRIQTALGESRSFPRKKWCEVTGRS